MLFKKNLLAVVLPSLLLAGCGGGNSTEQLAAPTFSLAISDAPVDDLSAVVVCFNQVELKRSGDDAIFTVGDSEGAIAANDLCLDSDGLVIPNTVGLNLLDYTGSDSIALVENISIEAGDYTQLRLIMSEGSYGIDAVSEEKILVTVPSNELKLDGFTAVLGGTVDFTLEFDLRKGMTNPVGQTGYFLKPRGVRLVDNTQSGHIAGTVSETLLLENQCTVNDSSQAAASIYLYQDGELELASLVGNSDSPTNPVLAISAVYFDDAGSYNFEIGFVPLATYTIAVTCDTTDDPEADDEILFIESHNITLDSAGTTESINFGS